MDLRKDTIRRAADWPAFYRFEGDACVIVGPCRVVNISQAGAGIEVFGDIPIDATGRPITVDVSAHGTLDLQLEGVVRNIVLGASGGLRLGLEFIAVPDLEETLFDELEGALAVG
jgi:hypothetical protein